MSGMFWYAKGFNQDLSGWNVNKVVNKGAFNNGAPHLKQLPTGGAFV